MGRIEPFDSIRPDARSHGEKVASARLADRHDRFSSRAQAMIAESIQSTDWV